MNNIRLFQTQSEFDNSSKVYPQITYVEENGIIKVGKISDTIKKDGVYILEKNGTCTPQSTWNGNKENTVGVAIVKGQFKFVIAKENLAPDIVVWGTYGKLIDGIMTTTDMSIAITDNSGASNTDKIITQDSPACVAAIKCSEYVFPNGVKGYLGTVGEWYAAYSYKADVNSAMTKIGGVSINEYWYWSSTQYSSSRAWELPWSNGYVNYNRKDYYNYCRAFGAF